MQIIAIRCIIDELSKHTTNVLSLSTSVRGGCKTVLVLLRGENFHVCEKTSIICKSRNGINSTDIKNLITKEEINTIERLDIMNISSSFSD